MKLSKWAGRLGAVLGLVLGGLVLTGCATKSPQSNFSPVAGGPSAAESPADSGTAASAPPVSANPGNQVLTVGDLLTITFADIPVAIMPFEGRIKEDGTITLLLNQTFTAAGKTEGGLEREIRERYVPRFFKYMTVTVRRAEGSRFIYVDGEVKSPGKQSYVARIRVLEA